MSMHRMEEVTCPHCQKKGQMQIWQSVNTVLDPETREQVRTGRLFEYTCPSCGAVTNVNYGFLYHQMEDLMMIYYVMDEENCRSAEQMFSGKDEHMSQAMGAAGFGDYLLRIVMSQNGLREKLFIFDQGLDDRLIEIIKFLYDRLLADEHPELDVEQGYFSISDSGEWQIDFFGEQGYAASVKMSRETYQKLEQDLKGKLPEFRRGVYLVDGNWAEEFIREHMG